MFGRRSNEPSTSRRALPAQEAAPTPVAKPAEAKVAAIEPRMPARQEPVVHERRHSEEYYDVKTTVFNALIDTIDLTQLAKLEAAAAREEIRDIVSEIIQIKSVVMSIAEQEELLERSVGQYEGIPELDVASEANDEQFAALQSFVDTGTTNIDTLAASVSGSNNAGTNLRQLTGDALDADADRLVDEAETDQRNVLIVSLALTALALGATILATRSITRPMRRSPRLRMPSTKLASGSCQRSCAPDRRSESRSRPTLRCSSGTPFWPNHWNGVCALGTNPPTETVQLAREVERRPIATTLRASSAMPRVSSSISVGRPTRKYSFTRRQPCE